MFLLEGKSPSGNTDTAAPGIIEKSCSFLKGKKPLRENWWSPIAYKNNKSSYMSKTGRRECSGRNKTGIQHETLIWTQWDHSKCCNIYSPYGIYIYIYIFNVETAGLGSFGL